MPALCLHKETRVNYEPSLTTPIIQLELPSNNTFSRASHVVSRTIDTPSVAHDEQDFRKTNIAASGSIFFRNHLLHGEAKYPRAISWRCVGDSTLELRSVDISRNPTDTKDASSALRIVFPYLIQNSGVVLADSAEDNTLSVFVATKSNELYTLSLKPSIFSKRPVSALEGDRWYKVARPSVLHASSFHRIFALSSLTLLVASRDGRLTRLSRKQGDDSSAWDETGYDEGDGIGSLRSLLPWNSKDTVRFEGASLSQRTVHAAGVSPDHQHVLTVSLDHYLKAWSVSSKRSTCARDLLNYPRAEEQATRYAIDPRTPCNLKIFECRSVGGSRYCAMTFSPYESGLFKIWVVNDADSDDGITDGFEEVSLRLPDPGDGALWTFSDFEIQSSADTTELEVWILLRLNRRYMLYNRQFDDFASIGEEWGQQWTNTLVDASKHEPAIQPPSPSGLDHQDISSKWINYLQHPDLVTPKVLETALAMYVQGRKNEKAGAYQSPLVERIASLVGSQVHAQTSQVEVTDFERLQQSLSTEWHHFWNVIKDLESLRWEPLSLSLDNQFRLPWISFADGCAPIRQCSNIEIIAHNMPTTLKHGISFGLRPSIEGNQKNSAPQMLEQQALLIERAAILRSSFSDETKDLCESMILEEMWLDPQETPAVRIRSFSQTCGFADDVPEPQHAEFVHSLGGKKGLNALNTELFLSMVEQLSTSLAKSSTQVSTEFGVRTIVRGAQDMVTLHLRILQDLFYLLIYLEVDINHSEFPMKHLEADAVFIALLEQLRIAQLGHWLATHTRPANRTISSTRDASQASQTLTVLEDLFARDIKPQDEEGHNQCVALTGSIRDLLTWCAGGNEIGLDKALVTIQCDLLKNGNIDLASKFERFQPRTPWSVYIQGRLGLVCRRYTEAAEHFNEASFGLSRPKPPSSEYQMSSSHLLDPLTASHLASGLPNYYSHIVSLFGSADAPCHEFVVRFARLALTHAPHADQRADLLSRLFHSALALAQFETAYSALVRFDDKVLQRNAIRELVSTMVAKGAVQELLALALPPGLSKEINKLLEDKARAEGQASITSGGRDVSWSKVLYAWRVGQGDLRGAAAVLVERLEGLGKRRRGAGLLNGASKGLGTKLDEYLVSINALALAGEDEGEEGWVFVNKEGGRRKVVRLKDLREAYGDEMDRVGALEMGRYGIVGEAEDDDDEDDVVMAAS